tara:strand:- start:333 stop:491 length:159 start_codon:yes stop_codon:yes gene_type:complete
MLYDVIDHFILVESNETFKGKCKPLYYTENKEIFDKYNDLLKTPKLIKLHNK